jgi:hypothetical protein
MIKISVILLESILIAGSYLGYECATSVISHPSLLPNRPISILNRTAAIRWRKYNFQSNKALCKMPARQNQHAAPNFGLSDR